MPLLAFMFKFRFRILDSNKVIHLKCYSTHIIIIIIIKSSNIATCVSLLPTEMDCKAGKAGQSHILFLLHPILLHLQHR